VTTSTVLPDISYTLRDGTSGTIDLSPVPSGGGQGTPEKTLGEILNRINTANPAKLKAEISSDGERLIVTDLTTGGGSFQLGSLYDSEALADLGLDGAAAGGVITGRRLLGGLQTVLLSSLNGGKGPGQLGTLQLTDRSGATATVNLSAAETLDDVVQAVNAAGLGITAQVNDARNGILLTDTTGSSTSHLVVADGDSTQTATKLNIAANTDGTSVNSGDLHLQVVSQQTRLKDLNGGAGVAQGTLTIYNSAGQSGQVNLAQGGIQTMGDLIGQINRLDLNIQAEINATGDGIALTDTSGGSGQ
jgi:flagellar hook-associated protein 2